MFFRALDKLENRNKWKSNPKSSLYDYQLVLRFRKDLREHRVYNFVYFLGNFIFLLGKSRLESFYESFISVLSFETKRIRFR